MPPFLLSQQVKGELDWIVMKALEKDRTRRYESASELAKDVQHYLNDEPVEACPPSKVYLLRRTVRPTQEVSRLCYRGRAGAGAGAGRHHVAGAERD